MNAPQVCMIVLLSLGLGIGIVEHGKPKTGKDNFFPSLLGALITAGILWWGGFWK